MTNPEDPAALGFLLLGNNLLCTPPLAMISAANIRQDSALWFLTANDRLKGVWSLTDRKRAWWSMPITEGLRLLTWDDWGFQAILGYNSKS